MSRQTPSSPAGALVVSGPQTVRGLKASFDDLDDDDYAAIGRAFAGVAPRLVLSGVGAVVGAAAGVALAAVSVVGGSAVVVGVVALAFVVGRREIRASLIDHGLAPALVDTIFRTRIRERLRADRRAAPPSDPWRLFPRTEDFVRAGQVLVDAARAEHER